jgi:alkyl hydroperoxide reductase subunit AhpC
VKSLLVFLRQITINDLPVGRNVDETLRLVQAFQCVEVHGGVCQADPKDSLEYFSKVE